MQKRFHQLSLLAKNSQFSHEKIQQRLQLILQIYSFRLLLISEKTTTSNYSHELYAY